MSQAAGKLGVGFVKSHRLLILDRDSKFSFLFKLLLENAGIRIVEIPHRAPNCNAYVERFVRSIKEERPSQAGSRAIITPSGINQGLGNELIEAGEFSDSGTVESTSAWAGF